MDRAIAQGNGVIRRAPSRVLALRDKDETSLKTASSGGGFSVLARPILDCGGVVFGAVLFEDGSVKHVAVDTIDGLELLKGSKYVQSEVRAAYPEVANCLSRGRRVLFTGTPCQCSGLISYLQSRGLVGDLETCDELIVCDLVCHGTPRQELFRAHQEWLAGKMRADDGLHGFRFRSKRHGWGLYYYYYYYYRNGKRREVCREADRDPYYRAFLQGLIYRPACYRCPFAACERVSDFTIGDYWGIERAHPGFDDRRGVSLMLVNTDKAEGYFEAFCKRSCEYVESTFELASRENRNLVCPTAQPTCYEALSKRIGRCLDEGNYEELFGRVLRPPFSAKELLRRLLPRPVLNAVHSIRVNWRER